jgi:hypothetical protein
MDSLSTLLVPFLLNKVFYLPVQSRLCHVDQRIPKALPIAVVNYQTIYSRLPPDPYEIEVQRKIIKELVVGKIGIWFLVQSLPPLPWAGDHPSKYRSTHALRQGKTVMLN